MSHRKLPYVALGAVVVAVLVVYWPVGGFPPIDFDDPSYVFGNPVVLGGLSLDGLAWAFTNHFTPNWHPLAWLSHMLDVQIFGPDPGWHHRVNVLCHVLNVVLLFAFLRWATGAVWRSVAATALFALHPLRVESVAWIAERKDVLCAFWWLATMLAYVWYARSPSRARYAAVLGCFALALLSKAMAVTLPATLLLLDHWPLGRLRSESAGRLVREKLPLFAMSFVGALTTYVMTLRGGALIFRDLPAATRVANAITSISRYLGMMVWPADLAVFYPHRGYTLAGIPAWHVAGSLLLIGAITWAVVVERTRRPYLLVGWSWYLVTVLPVIGLVQAGRQALADRFTYIPMIGVLVAVVWMAQEVLAASSIPRPAVGSLTAAVAVVLASLSRQQVATWRDSATVFLHAARVTEGNATAWKNAGSALFQRGQVAAALEAFEAAARIDASDADVWFDQGMSLEALGRRADAARAYLRALSLSPNDPEIRARASALAP
jgi:hypothetical protein